MSSSRLTWFKSSYSDSQGGACVEVALNWHKSAYSDFEDASCIEVATCPHTVHVRDSKLGATSPTFTVPSTAWSAFLAHAKS
ncbi:DUF397 domain-containing protein [Streptomyces sp. NPDC002054]|uniref:DUF397 domain-containing protein n=1 Tax=Streptomyces sp. NPDC002054 TaxID=3154663 RepID=UPI00332877E5